MLRRCIIFDKCLFPGYANRKALHKKSFPASDAVMFEFKVCDKPKVAYLQNLEPVVERPWVEAPQKELKEMVHQCKGEFVRVDLELIHLLRSFLATM